MELSEEIRAQTNWSTSLPIVEWADKAEKLEAGLEDEQMRSDVYDKNFQKAYKRNKELEAELAKEKESVTFLDAELDIKQRLVVAEKRVALLEAENEELKELFVYFFGENYDELRP